MENKTTTVELFRKIGASIAENTNLSGKDLDNAVSCTKMILAYFEGRGIEFDLVNYKLTRELAAFEALQNKKNIESGKTMLLNATKF